VDGVTRTTTAIRMGVSEFRRTPVLLALLVFLPAYMIGLFTQVAPDQPAVVHLTGETAQVSLTEAFPAFTAPMTAALLSGIAGLFLMQSAADADGRLSVAGYRAREVVLARLGLLVGVSAVTSLVAIGVMLVAFEPNHLAWFALATGLAALVYGVVGVLAGLLLDRLPGVYLVMFGAMLDLFLFQNPLATDTPPGAEWMPGHFPMQLAMDAGFAASVDAGALGWGLAYLAVLVALATTAFYRSVRLD
jgi:ABC-2 type transport system permease protein